MNKNSIKNKKVQDTWRAPLGSDKDKSGEPFAQKHADQHLGCVACQKSHHETSFCNCGRCYYQSKYKHDPHFGTFVRCACGQINLWD